MGVILKDFAISARRPEKLCPLRKTLRSTSADMLSTDPGLDRPRASRFSCRDVKASDNRTAMALDVKLKPLSLVTCSERVAIVKEGGEGAGEIQ